MTHPAEGKLLTCPFCGKLDAFAERFDLSSCYIQCNDCGAQGPTCCQDSDDEEMPGEDAARRAWNTRHSQGANATTNGMSFGEALDLAQEGLDRWREKEHNARWWRRIDGTPIPNDLLVNIAEVFAGRVVALSRDEKHVALSSTERPGAAE